ncbi:hypothetical protein EVAR_65845_1 [Eumeta japonica]|uniref:Nucleic-acid-binding protein from transposon X-element n=1 Tax=Eumeta variegata TaxID=151549 RepID=A0A4C2A667_EUMVA|nr:hypothetical protein EVAR_65845_1 [Eumeta japonica]
MKAAYRTYSLKEEREFRVVVKSVPKKFSLAVKTDLLAQKHSMRAVRRVTNCNREPLDLVLCLSDHGTVACTRNKDTDGPPACALCNTSGHTANYLGCPRAPKKYPLPNRNNRDENNPPTDKAAPRQTPARAVSKNI